jgi:FdhD protein
MIVTKVTGLGAERSTRRGPDELIVEEPMSIQLDGTLVATTMRTPGNDYELASGFCFTEGLLAGAPIIGVRYCADGSAVASEFNIVTVETGDASAGQRVIELRVVRQ